MENEYPTVDENPIDLLIVTRPMIEAWFGYSSPKTANNKYHKLLKKAGLELTDDLTIYHMALAMKLPCSVIEERMKRFFTVKHFRH